MELRRISSLLTVVAKFIAPPLGVLFVANFWFSLGEIRGPAIWWFYLVPVLTEAIVIWHAVSVKWVAIDELNGRLYVSNYFKEIAIPLSDIVDVKESLWSDPRRMKITLSQPSEFGEKIVFLGTYRFGGIFAGPHPIVNELQTLAAKARESHG